MKIIYSMVVVAIYWAPVQAAAVEDVSDNVYWGRVTDVYDGDSLTAEIALWPGQIVEAKVRIRDVDAPEIRGKCAEEKRIALNARDYLKQIVLGQKIMIAAVEREKYGRILAHVFQRGGERVSDLLRANGLARYYSGGQRPSWCR
ncbi:MAG: thermonuclease family protein [Sneathiella sp.]